MLVVFAVLQKNQPPKTAMFMATLSLQMVQNQITVTLFQTITVEQPFQAILNIQAHLL